MKWKAGLHCVRAKSSL